MSDTKDNTRWCMSPRYVTCGDYAVAVRIHRVEAEKSLVCDYWEPVFRYALRHTRSEEAARDLTTETFVRWLDRVTPDENDHRPLTATLRVICIRLWFDQLRQQKREEPNGELAARCEPASGAPPLEEQVRRRMLREAFWKCACRLSPENYVWLLSLVDGATYAQLMVEFGVSRQTVASRVKKVYRAMAWCLSRYGCPDLMED